MNVNNNNNDRDFHSDSAAEIDDVDSAMLDNYTSAEFVAGSSAAFLEPTQEVELSQITTMSGDGFVHSFSKINIFQIQISFARDEEVTLGKHLPSGNSPDQPTSFLCYCKKGCGNRSWGRQALNDHEVNGTGELSTKRFKCPRSGCDKGEKNESTFRSHVADDYDYVAAACPKCPDKSEVRYITKAALKKHQVEVHSVVIEEQFCPLKDASIQTSYTPRKSSSSNTSERNIRSPLRK
jgi:hypothetical protein